MLAHHILITLQESRDLGREIDYLRCVSIYVNKLCILTKEWGFFVMSATLQSYGCADELYRTPT